jgi:GT2 family glycosyltransferase
MKGRVTVVQVIYNHRRFIEPVFSAIFSQTYKDFHVVAVISGNDDKGMELLREKFPKVEIIDPGYNIGFSKGHNLVFDKYDSEFFQLVNPDLILEPTYIEEMVKAFADPKIGAATGKLYQISNISAGGGSAFGGQYLIPNGDKTNILDTTGVTLSKSGRGRDRGQHEVDKGQYDSLTDVQAVSGAGPMYRASALQATSYKLQANAEYFDEDFHSYWEDIDLSWRMANKGWKNIFVPSAVGYHGRGAGTSEKGYIDVVGYIKHHSKLSPRVRQLNYKNHIFLYLKNSPWLYPQFFVREFFMLGYIVLFEIGTLKVLPEMIKLLPTIWKKRKLILQ